MKRAASVLLCIALVAAATLTMERSAAGGEFVQVVRIGGDRAFPPFEYVTDTGAYQGFNVDLMNAVGIELGLSIEFVPMRWPEVLEALEVGDIVAIQGMRQTPARESQFLFSDPYLVNSSAIFVRAGEYSIFFLDDLNHRRVAIQALDAAYELVRSVPYAVLVEVDDHPSGIEMLVSGAVDAFVGNKLSGINIVQRRGLTEQVKIVGADLAPQPYSMAFRLDRQDLVELFNRGLAKVKQSGAFDKIYVKWFGTAIPPNQTGLQLKRLRLLMTVLGLIVGGALLVVAWNISLRQLVARKTAQIAGVSALNKQILDSSDEGIAAVDADLRFIWANLTAARLLGVDEASLVGKHVSDTILAPVVYRTNMRDVATGSAISFRHDVQIQSADGTSRLFRVRAMPLVLNGSPQGNDAEPERRGALLVFSDVTASVRSEEIEATSYIMDALAMSISGIASEIRKPLQSIRAYLQELPCRIDQRDFVEETIRFVPAQIDHVNDLIADLLVFSDPPAPQPELFSLDEAVEEAIERASDEATARGVIIAREMRPVKAFADRSQVMDAVYRVLSDAVSSSRYMGTVAVVVSATPDGWAEVEVCDRSPAPTTLGPVPPVSPIFRIRAGKIGLGAAVSYKVLQANGGLLTATQSGGTVCIKMRIPRHPRH